MDWLQLRCSVDFVAAALWIDSQKTGHSLMCDLFSQEKNEALLVRALTDAVEHRDKRRRADYTQVRTSQ